MNQTPFLSLPYLMPAQAQKHITHNEALKIIDALLQPSVIDVNLMETPSEPINGSRYIIGRNASGELATHIGSLAVFDNNVWTYYAPQPGWMVWSEAQNCVYAFSEDTWSPLIDLTSQQPIKFGINTEADMTNRLAVKSPAVLFSHDEGSDSSGDIRIAINKSASPDTASCLFQSQWSGRAEFGLTGDNDFHAKVSPDGLNWFEAMIIDNASGKVQFPNGGVRPQLNDDKSLFVDSVNGSDDNDGEAVTQAFKTISKAVARVVATDLGGRHVTIHISAGSYEDSLQLLPLVGGTCTLLGNTENPASVILTNPNGTNENCINAYGLPGQWSVKGIKLIGNRVGVESLGHITISDIEFATTLIHMRANFGGVIFVNGNYSISASAFAHCIADNGGMLLAWNKTVTLVGTPNFTGQFAQSASDGYIRCSSVSWNGSATGKRYDAQQYGRITTYGAGPDYFPGSFAGTVSTEGKYI